MTNWIEKYQTGKKLWKKEASYEPETDTYEAKYSLPEVRVTAPNLTVAKAVREKRDKAFGQMLPWMAAPFLGATMAASTVTAPVATILGMAGGIGGARITDKVVEKSSDGKYKSWTDLVQRKANISPVLGEFINPGGLIGGTAGALIPSAGRAVLSRVPGIGKDAPELGYHALNKEHWALHPQKLIDELNLYVSRREEKLSFTDKFKQTVNTLPELGFVYGMATANRLMPTMMKTPLKGKIRNVAENIMRLSGGTSRDFDTVKAVLKGKPPHENTYTGTTTRSTEQGRDLINLYLRGDETGFKRIDNNMETLDFGDRYRKLYPNIKYYEMLSNYSHGTPISAKSLKEIDNDNLYKAFIRRQNRRISTSYNPVEPIDDIAGHQVEISANRETPILITQDLWKFNPRDYSKKWGQDHRLFRQLTTEKQAALLDKVGTPFYLVQNNPVLEEVPLNIVSEASPNQAATIFNEATFGSVSFKDKLTDILNNSGFVKSTKTSDIIKVNKRQKGGTIPKAQEGVKVSEDRRNWLQRTNDRIQTAYNKNKPQLLKDFPIADIPGMMVEYVTGHSKDPDAGLAMVNPVGKVGTISKTIEGPIGSIPKEKIVEKISDMTFRTSEDLLSLAKRAKQHIADYIEHPIIKETAKRNTELSRRLHKRNPDIALPKNYKSSTLSPMSITNYRILNHSNPAQVSFNNKLPFNTGGRHHLDIIQHPEGPSYVGKIDINWNTHGIASAKNFSPDESKKQIMRTLEHEFGHHARIGNSRIEQLKADKLFKSHIPVIKEPINASSVIEHNKYIDYLTQPGEAAMNMRDLAGELGISIGQKYPGKEAVEHMLWKYIGGKDFIIPALKLNTKRDYKRVWDALTGKYIMVPSGIVGGSMYMNNEINK